ncbi:aldehyde dehydrogenase family protein [Candidatus Poriferisocius sp.]|uniref:aldehyde dehydrogenase family protein n=1 Tax=Candidatus Poriferisocius sp. TaxID=3101276 RepID=UPI003B5B2520
MWHEERLLIDGELRAADGGGVFETVNPATEEVLGVAADATEADAQAAVAAARRAFDTTDWAQDHEFRARCLRQFHAALEEQLEEMRALTVAEGGSPVMLTHGGPQLEAPVASVKWVADMMDGYQWTEDLGEVEAYGSNHRRWIEREPVGVVAAITAYNFPVQLNLAKLAPALAAGNTVVLKGAPDTPWSALALGRLIAEHTDIPPGVVNILSSSQHAPGEVLTTHPDVDMVTFTGSTATGRRIMAAASATVKKTFLELGGKSAYVVLDDADIASAATMNAFMVCTHAGQGCAIATRLVVPAAMADAAAEVASATLASIPYGDPTDPSVMMGPLISARQRDKVDQLVSTAVDQGATLAAGGRRPDHLPTGYYYEPTLLTGVGEDDLVAQEEVFGPVLAIIGYEGGDDEAVRIANNSIYGLSGAVSSADPERARAVARRIRSGTISVNGGLYYAPDAPFGGYKQSGIGREMGVAGFEEFLEIKTLAEPAGT